MLFFEPVPKEECRNVSPETLAIMKALEKRGFKDPVNVGEDLELINIGRKFPIIENAGTFTWNGTRIGFLRGLRT